MTSIDSTGHFNLGGYFPARLGHCLSGTREIHLIFCDFLPEFLENNIYPQKNVPLPWLHQPHWICRLRFFRLWLLKPHNARCLKRAESSNKKSMKIPKYETKEMEIIQRRFKTCKNSSHSPISSIFISALHTNISRLYGQTPVVDSLLAAMFYTKVAAKDLPRLWRLSPLLPLAQRASFRS